MAGGMFYEHDDDGILRRIVIMLLSSASLLLSIFSEDGQQRPSFDMKMMACKSL